MNYSATGFELVLTRKMSFYVVTYYLPSGLFVIVSWIRYSTLTAMPFVLFVIVSWIRYSTLTAMPFVLFVIFSWIRC